VVLPLVGRERALAQLQSALAAAGRMGVVAQIVGEPGIGKSRLAAEIARTARDEGRLVVEGRAQPFGPALPFSVFQDALRHHRRTSPGAPSLPDPVAASFPEILLPELGAPRGEPKDSGVVHEAASRYLAWLASDRGLVLVLEDLHWADASSHALIAHLARTAAQAPVLLLLTYRADPQAAESLQELRLALLRERRGEEIVLDPLDAPEVDALIHEIAPDLPVADVEEIRRLGQGVPFFVEELARAAADGCRPDPSDLPWSVRQTVLDRLNRLPEADASLLRWAAVLGPRFDLALLEEAAGVDTDSLLDSLDRLRKAGIVEDDDCRIEYMAFRHALMHEAVLHDLLAADRLRRHARVLRVAEKLVDGGREVPLDQLVHHAIGAGDRAAGFRYSLAAARESFWLGGYGEALGHYSRAAELVSDQDPQQAQAAFEHGRLLGRLGHAPAAIERLAVAREAFLEAGDRAGAAVVLSAAGEIRGKLGEGDAGLTDLRQAAADLPPDAPALARLQVSAALANVLMRSGRYAETVTVAQDALALLPADPSREEALEAVHLLNSMGCAAWPTDPEAARSSLEESLALARRLGDHPGVLRACNNLANVIFHDGLPDESARLRGEALEIARERGLRHEEAWHVIGAAQASLQAGDLDSARSAIALAERLVSRLTASAESSANLAWIQAWEALVTGRLDEACVRLAETAPAIHASGHAGSASACTVFHAVAELGRGDVDAAAECLARALAAVAGDGIGIGAPDDGLLALAVASVCGDAEAAEGFAALVPRWPTPEIAAAASALRDMASGELPPPGLIDGGASELDRRRMAWQGAVLRTLGAWALSRLSPDSTEAVALARSARAWFQAIDSPGWSRVADEVLRRLGQRAPTRLGSGAQGLTARESEVLSLLADGATNRQIAERLVITRPTAARHVANIFAKLGVRSRAQAARRAAELGLLVERTTR
jgi:DNA-binding NarL/FixJ family response regulator